MADVERDYDDPALDELVEAYEPPIRRCPTCHGAGQLKGGRGQPLYDCPDCDGTGKATP